MLKDSALIMEEDAARANDRAVGAGNAPSVPLFNEQDVIMAMKRFQNVDYGKTIQMYGTEICFRDAGHILGSATLEISLQGRKLVFSGDLGRKDAPILRDPERIQEADWLVVESTYGNRYHQGEGAQGAQLIKIIQQTVKKGGT